MSAWNFKTWHQLWCFIRRNYLGTIFFNLVWSSVQLRIDQKLSTFICEWESVFWVNFLSVSEMCDLVVCEEMQFVIVMEFFVGNIPWLFMRVDCRKNVTCFNFFRNFGWFLYFTRGPVILWPCLENVGLCFVLLHCVKWVKVFYLSCFFV